VKLINVSSARVSYKWGSPFVPDNFGTGLHSTIWICIHTSTCSGCDGYCSHVRSRECHMTLEHSPYSDWMGTHPSNNDAPWSPGIQLSCPLHSSWGTGPSRPAQFDEVWPCSGYLDLAYPWGISSALFLSYLGVSGEAESQAGAPTTQGHAKGGLFWMSSVLVSDAGGASRTVETLDPAQSMINNTDFIQSLNH